MNRLRDIFRYEFRYVLKKYMHSSLCIIAYVVATWYAFHKKAVELHDMGLIQKESYMDLLYYFFRGCEDFLHNESSSLFVIPGGFLLLHGAIAFFIGNSLGQKHMESEYNILLRCGNRKLWFMAKWLSVAMQVLWIYLLIYGILFVLSILGGYGISGISGETLEMITAQVIQGKPGTTSLILMLCVLPTLVSFALSELQLICSIIFGNIIGYVFVMCQVVVGVYYTKGFNLITYWMTLRNKNIVTYGVDEKTGVVVCIVLILASLTIGMIYIRKKDFYGGKGD